MPVARWLCRYNRNVTISNSEFAWIGDTAIAAWGWTDELSGNGTLGYDATAGDFPRFVSKLFFRAESGSENLLLVHFKKWEWPHRWFRDHTKVANR
jgi:hypothetical protein